MTDSPPDTAAVEAVEKLLAYYNFQDAAQTREQLLDNWLRTHPLAWVRLALIEALYQGRYKSVSVEYLLQRWQRRGQPVYHFSREFERLVCHNCPKTFLSLLETPTAPEEDPQAFLRTVMERLRPESANSGTKEASTRVPAPLEPDADELSESPSPPTPLQEVTMVLESADRTNAAEPAAFNHVESSVLTDLKTEDATASVWTTQPLAATARPSVVNSSTTTPIHRFTPSSRPSELYAKLAAMANAQG